MARTTWRVRPEEGRSAQGTHRIFFEMSPSIQGAGVLRRAGAVGPSGMLQAAGGLPGEEAALFSGEAVEAGASLEERGVGDLQVFQLLVEAIIEEVEGVAEEEQEKASLQEQEDNPEEQGQEHLRPGDLSERPTLEELGAFTALQVELRSANEKDQRA
ncbi:testis-specific Y-encoded protein 1-like [Muntiacus reevesi]|uniref:testis-specific Y-encoded protein 1-like n=1 Tax=Muntiacus reevesi TaxID=9886 RepID=UPI00330710D8